jgi:LmbE family N-acetylglucosaminyl deacetylase
MPQNETDYIPYHAEARVDRGRALVFAPHPDDEVFGCAGAIMQHVADGDEVAVIVVTDGAFGAGEEYAHTRQAESNAAGKILGYGAPIFWGLPDRGLIFDNALVDRIAATLTEYRPALVYAPSWWEIHPDHSALSLAVTQAVSRTTEAVQLFLYEVGVPLHPNLLLDISARLGKKQAAMACFTSQMAQQAYGDHVLALNRFRTYTLPSIVHAAEAYRRIPRPIFLPPAPLMSRMNTPVESGRANTVESTTGFAATIWSRSIQFISALRSVR